MARTGLFGGFAFDPEVFADYVAEQPTWSNAIIASGILQEDATIMDLIGDKGNVATLPFYRPVSIDTYSPLNNDGKTNNTPQTVVGGKQTAMLIQRMQAWKVQDFTKELTGADPLQHVANSVANYYQQVWERELMNIADAVMGLAALADHKYDVTASGSTVTDANKVDPTTMIYATQKAFGDSTNPVGIAIMHSAVYARYKALGLVDFNKYTVANTITDGVILPTINGMIPIVSDRYTVDTSGTNVVYKTTLVGQGAFLTAPKTNYEEPYYTDYDPETTAGVQKLYTKQGRVLHPNGVSIKATNIVEESPTFTELGTTANWDLAFDAKNVRIGQVLSNG